MGRMLATGSTSRKFAERRTKAFEQSSGEPLPASGALRRQINGMKKFAMLLMLIPGLALASTASLETKAKAAFSDIAKAKTALNEGKTKTSSSWLTKAKTLLSSVMQHQGAEPQAQSQQAPNALSSAEQRAQQLEPGLAGKLGLGGDQTQAQQAQPSGGGLLGEVSDLKSTYDKVSLAQSLLHKGDSTQAKSVLDEIPTSPADALKLLKR
jgi:hypothetical protein